MSRSMLRSRYARCAALATALPAALPALAVAQFAPTGQFAPPAPTPPILRDRIESEWVNLETELIEPIAWIAAGSGHSEMVAVANEPDDRVVFLDANLNFLGDTFVGQGPATLAKNPAAPELWVSVRNQSCVVVIDLVTRQVTHLLRPPIATTATGVGSAAAPGGIAFSDGRAYVAATATDELLVYDAASKAFVTAIALQANHFGQPVRLNDPFGVTAFGGKVYVTSHLSGNNTTARIAGGLDLEDGDATPSDATDDVGFQHLGPDDVSIVRLGQGAFTSLALPDFDVAVINPAGNQLEAMVRGLGTVLFDVEGRPGTQQMVVPNLESRNAEFVGEAAFPQGRVAFNRLTWFDAATGALVGAPLVTERTGFPSNLVMPTDVEFSATGRMFVAAYSSAKVGVFHASGAFQGAITTDSGPRGVALDGAGNRLFVYCRAAGTVKSFDASQSAQLPTPIATIALPDPTPDRVKVGRQLFLTPRSGAGTANCASCHIDGRIDGVAWNLSKTASAAPSGANPAFIDRKGVMVTQFLLGLEGAAPFHWRGEQEGIESFNGAFVELLKGQALESADLALLVDYVESLRYPPNPRQQLNREHSHASAGGNFIAGSSCIQCHFLPLGTSGDLGCALIGDGGEANCVKTAQLRGLWLKESGEADIDFSPQVERVRASGYGVLHEGVVDDLAQFLSEFFPQLSANHTNLVAFVDQLDTGLAPAAAYSERLDLASASLSSPNPIADFLIPQADAGHCDLVARGQLDEGAGMVDVGLVWRRATPSAAGYFEGDLHGGTTPTTWSFAQLQAKAGAGAANLLFCGVPLGSGERMGVDRDRDRIADRDELLAGTTPTQPDSDDDGWWDGEDSAPGTTGVGQQHGYPSVVPGSIRLVYATTNAIKISYETDRLSPTIVRFGPISALGGPLPWAEGDGLQPLGPATTNAWKRRHTVVLGPQPTAQPPLPLLDPGMQYVVEIVTQGQNGSTATSGPITSADIAWQNSFAPLSQFIALPNNGAFLGAGSSFRTSDLGFTAASGSGGNWDYDASAGIEVTWGTAPASLVGQLVPARFTLYHADGTFSQHATVGAIQSGASGYFVDFSVSAIDLAHASGDRVTIDLPMWIGNPGSSGPPTIGFPVFTEAAGGPGTEDDLVHVGNWSDSVVFAERIAP